MKRLVLYITFALAFSSACSKAEYNLGGDGNGSSRNIDITGTVVSAVSGYPIVDAEVSIMELGTYVRTNSVGEFVFTDCAPGRYSFVTIHQGYVTKAVSRECTASDKEPFTIQLADSQNQGLWSTTPISLFIPDDGRTEDVSFKLHNNDTSDGNWSIETNATWVKSITPLSGTLSSGETASIRVRIDRAFLTESNNAASLLIRTGSNILEVPLITPYTDPDKDRDWAVVSNGLTAYYSFNGNIRNMVSDDFHGISEKPDFTSGIKQGQQALQVYWSSDFVTIPAPMMDGKTTTVCFWLSDISANGHIMSVTADKGPLFDYSKAFFLEMKQSRLRYIPTGRDLYVYYDTFAAFNHERIFYGWHHIAITTSYSTVTYDVEATLYINGVKADKQVTKAYSEYAKFGKGISYTLGGDCENTSNQKLRGCSMDIAHLRFYDRCLTANEIKKIYNAEKR